MPARRHAHQLRATADAILVGAQTVRTDNPRLTVRGVPSARQPHRVVLSRSGNLPQHAHLFSDRHASRTLIYRRKSLAAVLKNLGERGVTTVLIEGGGEVFGQSRVPMRKCTSRLGSGRATTDIIHPGTITRTAITGRTTDPTIDPIIGTAGIVTIVTIGIITTIGAKLT